MRNDCLGVTFAYLGVQLSNIASCLSADASGARVHRPEVHEHIPTLRHHAAQLLSVSSDLLLQPQTSPATTVAPVPVVVGLRAPASDAGRQRPDPACPAPASRCPHGPIGRPMRAAKTLDGGVPRSNSGRPARSTSGRPPLHPRTRLNHR